MRAIRSVGATGPKTLEPEVRRPGGRHPFVASVVALGLPVLVGITALHLLWLAFGWGGEERRALLGNLLFVASSSVATVVGFGVAWLHRGEARRGWLIVALALAAQAGGYGVWGYLEVVARVEPFPSPGDLCYLLFGPLLAAGFAQLTPPPRDRLEGARLGLDLAVTVGAAALFFWHFLLAPPLTWGLGVWATAVTLAYPLLDLLLLGLLLLMVLRERRGEPPRLDLLLLGVGVAVQVGADLLYGAALAAGSYATGHPMDGLWSVSTTLYVVAACAGLRARRTPGRRRAATLHGYVAVALPYLAVAAGLGLLLAVYADPAARNTVDGQGVVYGAVFVVALVIARQVLAFGENWRLAGRLALQSEALEGRVQERTAELAALTSKYRHDALHDALTGLPNRAHFQKRLGGALDRADPFAVLYLDFDRFKAVNDSFGHAVGDALLVAIGERLAAALPTAESVARLGGDEFAVLLTRVGSVHQAAGVADALLRALETPAEAAGHRFHVAASIGVVMSSGGGNAEGALRDADIAMYRAKAAGRGRYVVFEAAMRDDVQARLALELELRAALARGELRVHYQPVLLVGSGGLVGFEALVRWPHPGRGLVPPGAFIPLAEETGLITELDRWVLRTACAQLKAWLALAPGLAVSVNLSSRGFSRPDLAAFVAEVLAGTGVPPAQLRLELTESLLADATPAVRDTLAALRRLGVGLHIDDFGTGYSSLAYLQRFDADALKIDRSFVAKMLEHEDSAELVRTIVGMAHNLGMEVVAEGVETPAQRDALSALGCRYAQGFLFSKPLPAAAAEGLLRGEKAAANARQPEFVDA